MPRKPGPRPADRPEGKADFVRQYRPSQEPDLRARHLARSTAREIAAQKVAE
jgi:hypothetical protein